MAFLVFSGKYYHTFNHKSTKIHTFLWNFIYMKKPPPVQSLSHRIAGEQDMSQWDAFAAEIKNYGDYEKVQAVADAN